MGHIRVPAPPQGQHAEAQPSGPAAKTSPARATLASAALAHRLARLSDVAAESAAGFPLRDKGPLQREINPDFRTWLRERPTFEQASKALVDEYYRDYVASELARAEESDTEGKIPAAKDAYTEKYAALNAATGPGAAFGWVNIIKPITELIKVVNDVLARHTKAARAEYFGQIELRGAAPTAEEHMRWQRRERQTLVPIGTTHKAMIRGFKSSSEAQNTLTNLRTRLRACGLDDVQVAARGSAIRGTDRTGTRAYRAGLGDTANVNDSSDIDFFFFSPKLEAKVTSRLWRAGGNVHPDDLNALLDEKKDALERMHIQVDQLKEVLDNFSTQTKALIGRKSDVTLLKLEELGNFAANEYALV